MIARLLPTLALALVAAAPAMAADGPVYELRTYHANAGKLDALNARFRDHTTALFKTHGMTNVGYWTPSDDKDGKGSTLVYLLSFPSRDAAKKSWDAFRADPEWQKVKAASEKDGALVGKVDSVYLEPTDYSPDPTEASGEGRVYELRTYTASEGKLDDLNRRFREHTMDLFKKHGMTNVVYTLPLDEKDGQGKTLVYLLAHPSREAASASWKAFGADPEWQKVYKESQPDNIPLAAKVTSVYLEPTDYSPLK